MASPGLLARAELNRQRGGPLVRARITGFEGLGGTDQTTESLLETSVLVGGGRPCCVGNWGGWALGGGIVTGSLGESAARQIRTVGLSGEAFLISGAAPHISLAVGGNLNPQRSFATLSLSILLGRMPFLTVASRRRLPF